MSTSSSRTAGSSREPMFIKDTLADPGNAKPAQGAGPIHVHPNGRFVYVTNRNQGEVDVEGKKGLQRRREQRRGVRDR